MTSGRRATPVLLLIVSIAGMIGFSQGFRIVDTVGMLASGAVAGGALASLAARRRAKGSA